jgi:hypothetical protein
MRVASRSIPLALVLSLVSVGCSPRAVPESPGGPADPDAPSGPPPSKTVLTEGDPAEPADGAGPADPHAGHDHGRGTPDLLAVEKTAFERAAPVLDKHCARCHTSAGSAKEKMRNNALKHFSLDSYPPGGHHADEITEELREVLGVDPKTRKKKKRPTMPLDTPGAVSDQELEVILAWADAFDAAEAAGLHGKAKKPPHGGHKH